MEDSPAVDLASSTETSPDLPEALQAPTRQVSPGFMILLTASAMSLYILYAGIGALLLPYQIGLLAPGQKVAILSFFTSITVLIALFANPLAGALSDRTTSRFGRRRPWILMRGLLTAVGLFFIWLPAFPMNAAGASTWAMPITGRLTPKHGWAASRKVFSTCHTPGKYFTALLASRRSFHQ